MTLATGVLAVMAFACSDDETTLGSTTNPQTGGNGGTNQGGDPGTGAGGTSQGGNNQGGNGGTGPLTYPPGPYGYDLGDTFEPIEMAGWTSTNPTARINTYPFGAYTMANIRADHPNSFVLLHLSGMF